MRCVNCNKEINDDEVLCSECKKKLKKESSRTKVNELEKEIELNKQLNEDDNTKELTDLESLVKDQIVFDDIVNSEEIKEEVELSEENKITEKREDKFKPKKSKKKIIIIISILVIVIAVVIVLLLFLKKEEKEEEIKLDYQKILNRYGRKLENKLSEYDSVIEWEELIDNIEYDYNISCNIHEIYSDKKIYLDECKIDNKKIKYSYGSKQEEKKLISIDIHKSGNKYSSTNGDIVGTITCESEDCEYVEAYDNYVIIKENKLYNLYNYYDNNKVFGPFNDISNLIYIDNTLYAIYYSEGNSKNIYSTISNKIIENVSGNVIFESEKFDPKMLYKYDLVMLKDKSYNFINLKSGRIVFTIDDNILKFEEDVSNNVVYIFTYKKDINHFKVINTHGKYLLDSEINYFKLLDDGLIIANDTSFKVYDSKLNVKVSSKEYDNLISIYDDFAIVFDKSAIKLVDLEDNTLSSFETEIKYEIDKEKSGRNKIDGKEGIFIMFKNSSDKLFYDPNTGELELLED